jgi:hypothetical protein
MCYDESTARMIGCGNRPRRSWIRSSRWCCSSACNDLLIEDVVVIPLAWRNEVVAVSQGLQGLGVIAWDSNLWDLVYWYREV